MPIKLSKINKHHNIYADYIEPSALEQFINVMNDDRIIQGALMPDVHTGYTLPIGGVIASNDWVFPAFVGYDIGCGVLTCNLGKLNRTFNIEDRNSILEIIPVGFNNQNNPIEKFKISNIFNNATKFAKDEFKKSTNQLGTLGSGNHFIELGVDVNDNLYCTIHSGSRNFGHTIASHYMALAANSDKPKEGIFGFNVNSENGKNYINDLLLAQEFALINRLTMLELICDLFKLTKVDEIINRNHNHAELKDNMWVHRKGATHAEKGMLGVIPGNMRDGVYIVEGLGNPDSLYSSSHGAGRKLSRSKAKVNIDINEFKSTMGNIIAKVDEGSLDESPMAYKDFEQVMSQQTDLCKIIKHIRPILNVKS